MQYHLVLTDEEGYCVALQSVEGHATADRAVRALLADRPAWRPTRYPGRSWRRGEIAVYMDRATSVRRELSVLRCAADHDGAPLDCPLRSLGIPALNLRAEAESVELPVQSRRPVRPA